MVHIIGGRFGTKSGIDDASISQHELGAAIEADKPVFIFVEKGVHTEHVFYRANKNHKDVNFPMVDDVRIHQFLDEVAALPRNNPTQAFESSQDITSFLREQWAGLFQRYLSNLGRQREVDAVQSLQQTAKAFDELVALMREMHKDKDAAISDLVLSNHPIFERLRTVLNVRSRVFFTTHEEMVTWLDEMEYEALDQSKWDSPDEEEFGRAHRNKAGVATRLTLLKVWAGLFEAGGGLRPMNRAEWQDSAISVTEFDDPETEPEPQRIIRLRSEAGKARASPPKPNAGPQLFK